MSNYIYEKFDFVIIVILALLVAFIIGFNIIQVIDNKLKSVTINVPPQQCSIPSIYLNIDKNLNIGTIEKQISDEGYQKIKLNDLITSFSNNSIDNFGNLADYPDNYTDKEKHISASIINSNNLLNTNTKSNTELNPDYNNVDNIPLLISPDTDVPNSANSSSKGYYIPKIKLIENKNSPLMKLYEDNKQKINNIIKEQNNINKKNIPEINGTFDGYNAYVDLKTDSYANITAIGKGMLTPYTSYPVPS